MRGGGGGYIVRGGGGGYIVRGEEGVVRGGVGDPPSTTDCVKLVK